MPKLQGASILIQTRSAWRSCFGSQSRAPRSTILVPAQRVRDLRTMRSGCGFSDGQSPDARSYQPVAIFRLFPAQPGRELFQIVSAFRGDLIANPPDLFKNFMFHSLIIPSIRKGCRLPARENLPAGRRPATVPRLPRWQYGGNSRSGENPCHAPQR